MKEEFIETTCCLIDSKIEDMGLKSERHPVRISFLPSRVESYRENIDDDDTEPSDTECLVGFKSGASVIVNMSYDELKQKISERNLLT